MSSFFYSAKNNNFKPDEISFEPSDFVIRVAQQQDLSALVEILAGSFHPRNGLMRWFFPIMRMGMYEDLRQRLRSLQTNDYVCLVATTSSRNCFLEVMGTVEVALRASHPLQISGPYPYISNLAVQPKYRRQGVAQTLLSACEKIVLNRGFQDLYLHVLEDNQPARQLYFKSGFELKQADPIWCSWLLRQPGRILLHKNLSSGLVKLIS